jgi:uncharacterized protein (TIGR02246 family)
MATKPAIWSAIEAADQKLVSAFGRGDAAGIAQLYTEDGQILPPQSEPITGRHGIQAFWQGAMDMGVKAAKLESVEVEGHGDSAVEIGKYELYAAGQQRVDHGKYVVIWKREQGEWMLWRDIWNTSVPPPA